MVNIIKLQELSYITKISENTLRSWLSGWRFAKYRLNKDYKYSNEFIQVFINFLEMKRKYIAIDYLQNFINQNEQKSDETNKTNF